MPIIKKIPFPQRIEYCNNPAAKHLCDIISSKQSLLAVAADLTQSEEVLKLADQVGSEICLLKTHVDILQDFTPAFITQLLALAKKHNFLIFEDRKFADIGYTVKQQYAGGIYHIADWAHITNAHALPGPGIVTGLQAVGLPKQRGLLLLAEMSSQGTLAQGAYAQATVELAKCFPDFVMGFIAQRQLSQNPGLLHLTPGIQWQTENDSLGQRYINPEQAILEQGTDIIIVGRGIYQSKNPAKEASRYRQASWQTYKKVI